MAVLVRWHPIMVMAVKVWMIVTTLIQGKIYVLKTNLLSLWICQNLCYFYGLPVNLQMVGNSVKAAVTKLAK